jgi:outer membrane receptor protein involved in Fe transport
MGALHRRFRPPVLDRSRGRPGQPLPAAADHVRRKLDGQGGLCPARSAEPAGSRSAPSSSPPATSSRQTATGTLPSGAPFAASSLVDGSWLEYAGYVTYQFELAGFTIMPGLRLEGREYDLGGTTGVPDLKTTRFFPSLHTERQLAPWLTGSASYSRRITYPPIQLLNPALNFQDATTAQAGNPALQPQLTDSYEVRLRGHVARHNLELTAFRRTTEDIWSFRGEVNPDGVLVTGRSTSGRRR